MTDVRMSDVRFDWKLADLPLPDPVPIENLLELQRWADEQIRKSFYGDPGYGCIPDAENYPPKRQTKSLCDMLFSLNNVTC